MRTKKQSYAQALKRLEEIVRQLENEDLDINELLEKAHEAKELTRQCHEMLMKADKEIENLLQEKTECEE